MKDLTPNLPMLLALLVFQASCSHRASVAPADSMTILNLPVASQISGYEQRALALTNRERQRRGLRPVRHNAKLRHSARRHSAAMADGGYVGHHERGGSDSLLKRVRRSGYHAQSVRENVYGPNASRSVIDHKMLTPAEAVRQWILSPGHRRNLLAPDVTEIGMGYDRGYWTQVLARPDSFHALKQQQLKTRPKQARKRSGKKPAPEPFMWRHL